MKLKWIKVAKGHYRSAEERGGTPDFVIRRYQDRATGVQWRCKMRTSAKATWFNTLGDAKDWAESI